MGAAYFYHLTRSPLGPTLAMLAGKSLGAGWRVEVRGRSLELLQSLDLSLWNGDGFLPHGLAGGPHDADQPVLLTTDGAGTPAECLMAIEGVDVSAAAVGEKARVCVLFDGTSDAAVRRAREQWKALTGAGVAAQYWSEESGRWEKKAEANTGD